ncbi:uncharacterized protein LOC135137936 [Zophobas morio]|uniref:uncharacterized protein LOC135137936 n=1 Tax=Zophobas morio TaxID=2755281 RepID=UPI0030829AF3
MATVAALSNGRASLIKRVEALVNLSQQARVHETVRGEFFIRAADLNHIVAQFEQRQLQIVELCTTPEQLDEQYEVQSRFDDMQYSIKSVAAELNREAAQSSAPRGNLTSTNVKLPKIQIPTFDGQIKNWPTFYDLFRSLIHNNPNLSAIEKFQYLSTSLAREASTVIKNLPISAANYTIAFDALVARYNNKRVLLTNYWQAIYSAPKVNGDSPSLLRNLLNVFSENLAALKQYDEVDLWDFTLLNLMLQKLDTTWKQKFELSIVGNSVPAYNDLQEFLLKHCTALETSVMTMGHNSASALRKPTAASSVPAKRPVTSSFVTRSPTSKEQCLNCSDEHPLTKCDAFLEMEPRDRHTFARKKNLCYNCLSRVHSVSKCPSKVNCRVCNCRHHTLLHFVPKHSAESGEASGVVENPSTDDGVKVMTNAIPTRSFILLATARIIVVDSRGKYRAFRALLDTASEATFVTERCAKVLGLPQTNAVVPIQGLNQMSTSSTSGVLKCEVRSHLVRNFSLKAEMVVVPQICGDVPTMAVSQDQLRQFRHLRNLELADPEFGTPQQVDVLLGADVYGQIVTSGFKKGRVEEPSALNTVFGWVLIGGIKRDKQKTVVRSFCTSIDNSLDAALKRFWQLEQVPQRIMAAPQDVLCEEKFTSTISRDIKGRYVVQLPFADTSPSLGRSFDSAMRRFLALEARLFRDKLARQSYHEFMKDYIDQGHMTVIPQIQVNKNAGFYIPHHGIARTDPDNAKFRVVFDASAKSSNGNSLNDVLLVGPKLQADIGALLMVFRTHNIVFTADIRQMYRQIAVAESQRLYQKILWRFSPEQPINEYYLNTVTYGVCSSPYLAIRTLAQLVKDEGHAFPLGAQVLKSCIYVDDVVAGASSIEDARETQEQLIKLLNKGGFELRKWASNSQGLVNSVPTSHQRPYQFPLESPGMIKLLGLQWCPQADIFSYTINPDNRSCTKRNILSEIARIYDPLGFLAPLTLMAKQLIQTLWSIGIGWDDAPPAEIVNLWNSFQAQVPELGKVSIPRQCADDGALTSELHGFADASERGFGAVVYLRQSRPTGEIRVSLIAGKSRVAPLKTVSLPRLELCAAVLAADLLSFVRETLKGVLNIHRVYAWSDSKVALTWIRSPPYRWATFVANRVAHIQDLLEPSAWNHVSGRDNPADCASRGLLPQELVTHPLWWAGPTWLAGTEWPPQIDLEVPTGTELEARQRVLISRVIEEWPMILLNRFSSLRKIEGIIAYCLRFVQNLRIPKEERESGPLHRRELHRALLVLVRMVQSKVFANEIRSLKKNGTCSKPFRKLSPFLDDGLIRVGGRLQQSELPYEAKHPLLLPRSHRLTELIIEAAHRTHLHVGFRTLQYLLLREFWILSSRRAIEHTLRRCNRCFRVNPKPITPFMGELPRPRVTQAKVFTHCGVDFAGPFSITMGRRRGAARLKAYVCVFVCFAVKAIHLELVSNLTSEGFLGALRRLVARRGQCTDIYSDCGTNFVGANNLLQKYMQAAAGSCGIKWHFNPPSAPHMGGLWEAGVKSFKSHLKRVVGEQLLTFEEFSTVLAQIEAVLNSRPLCPVSADNPEDLSVLTPGHFLTTGPLVAVPDEPLEAMRLNRLSRWQLVQRLHQDFWHRWQQGYLHTLQQRNKWNTSNNLPSVDTLVVIKGDSVAPLQWQLGRIVALHPGKDGIVRVAQVRTTSGLITRPLVKLCPLPRQ